MADTWLRLQGEHGDVTVAIDVEHGGRVAQITVDGVDLLIAPPSAGERDGSVAWGSYPMAPWAGRVRDGIFTWFGREQRLHLNQDDGGTGAPGRQHAMHGTVLARPWTIDEQTASSITISCDLDEPPAGSGLARGVAPGVEVANPDARSGWRLGGIAHQRIELLDGQLRCDLSVSVSPGGAPHPAEIGWHPWWRKPDALSFHPDAMYERDAIGLPTGRLVAPTPGPWDDCFVNTAPVTLHYERESVREVTVSSDCDHWVVYDMPEHATCVEPQSGPPDAFNLRPQIATGAHPLRRTMIVGW
jgi:aldose 1-epimerase